MEQKRTTIGWIMVTIMLLGFGFFYYVYKDTITIGKITINWWLIGLFLGGVFLWGLGKNFLILALIIFWFISIIYAFNLILSHFF